MNVYKYRFGSKRDLDSLQQNYFYAPNSLELNDPYEGIFIRSPAKVKNCLYWPHEI